MGQVLVIDDEPFSARVAGVMLGRVELKATMAYSIAEAWERLFAEPLVDLIVLDHNLGPTVQGFEFMHQLVEDPLFAHVPVVVYTATPDRDAVVRYVKLGVRNVFVKPYQAEKLREEYLRGLDHPWRHQLLRDLLSPGSVSRAILPEVISSAFDWAEEAVRDLKLVGPLLEQGQRTQALQIIAGHQAQARRLALGPFQARFAQLSEALRERRADAGVPLAWLLAGARLLEHELLPLRPRQEARSGAGGRSAAKLGVVEVVKAAITQNAELVPLAELCPPGRPCPRVVAATSVSEASQAILQTAAQEPFYGLAQLIRTRVSLAENAATLGLVSSVQRAPAIAAWVVDEARATGRDPNPSLEAAMAFVGVRRVQLMLHASESFALLRLLFPGVLPLLRHALATAFLVEDLRAEIQSDSAAPLEILALHHEVGRMLLRVTYPLASLLTWLDQERSGQDPVTLETQVFATHAQSIAHVFFEHHGLARALNPALLPNPGMPAGQGSDDAVLLSLAHALALHAGMAWGERVPAIESPLESWEALDHPLLGGRARTHWRELLERRSGRLEAAWAAL